MAIEIADFKTAAYKTFVAIRWDFGDYCNFWRLGHAFDTIIDYFVTCPDKANDTDEFGKTAYQRYKATAEGGTQSRRQQNAWALDIFPIQIDEAERRILEFV